MRVLSTLLTFGVDRKLLPENPIKELKKLRVQSEGWEPWTDEEIETWTKISEGASRVAFFLALYTGQRRADVLKMRWEDLHEGTVSVRQNKTGKELVIPIDPRLQVELTLWKASRKVTGQVIVHRENGQPYTDDGFGTIWNREQHRVGVHAPFHGLRKNATIRLIEVGCTPAEVQAITGHETTEMIEHYSRKRDQKLLARRAMDKLKGDGE